MCTDAERTAFIRQLEDPHDILSSEADGLPWPAWWDSSVMAEGEPPLLKVAFCCRYLACSQVLNETATQQLVLPKPL